MLMSAMSLVMPLVVVVVLGVWAAPASAEGETWVRSEEDTELWSGPDSGAVSFGLVSRGSYFLVASSHEGGRLYVYNPVTKGYAYVDADAVAASGAPREVAEALTVQPATRAVVGSGVLEEGGVGQGTGVAGAAFGSTGYGHWWVQNHRSTELWSGPDSRAVSFGGVGQWSYFLVVEPQRGPRLHVLNPVTNNYAYIEAASVGPSGPWPSAARPVLTGGPQQGGRRLPVTAAGYEPWWVANFVETELWSGTEKLATSLGKMAQFRRFMVLEPQKGDRLRVWYPEKDLYGYVDGSAVGPSGPSVWMQSRTTRLVREVNLPARSISFPNLAYVRNLPVVDEETELRPAPNNSALQVRQAVVTADGTEWYLVGDGEYILASEVRLPRPVSTVGLMSGRWIDADLAEPTMITAYEGGKVVRTMLAIRGVEGAPTTMGSFRIQRRVESETMDSETIGIPRDSEKGYLLKNVLYTQYFTGDGAAVHYNYWLGTFGFPGSHGCLGVDLEDSEWLWEWAGVGTPIVVRDSGGDGTVWASRQGEAAAGAMAITVAPEAR